MTNSQQKQRRRLMAEAVRGGCEPEDVAATYGVCLNSVKLACREHRVCCTEPQVKLNTLKIIAALLNTVNEYSDIATQLGFHENHVRIVAQRAKDAGIRIPGRMSRGTKETLRRYPQLSHQEAKMISA